ncbi:hypothetical protein ACFFGX_03225, partial [Azorhizophilus paspali]
HGRVDDASAKIGTVCSSHSGLLVRAGEENRNDQEEQPLYVEFVFSKNALALISSGYPAQRTTRLSLAEDSFRPGREGRSCHIGPVPFEEGT